MADGRSDFVEVVKEFGLGQVDARLLEVLCCNGCIMGPGFSTLLSRYNRRSRVSDYVHERIAKLDRQKWLADLAELSDIDLGRTFPPSD